MRGHIRKRQNGVYEINWESPRGPNGERHRGSATVYGTKAEAKAELTQQIAQAERQRSEAKKSGPKKLLVWDWLRTWHGGVVMRDLKTSTQERYLSIIELHLIPHVGDIPLAELSPLHVDDLHQTLLDLDLDPRTIELVHCVISGACKHAVRLQIIPFNPVAAVPPPKARKKELKIPSIKAVAELLCRAEEEKHYLFVFIHLLAYTGMRRGEAMALRWRNVNLRERYLDVEVSVVKTHHLGLILETPKTQHSKRRIYLVAPTVKLLARHKEEQQSTIHASDLPENVEHDDWVFPAEDGSWMKPSNMLRDFKLLGQRAGIPGLTFHMLRHFHATVSLKAEGDLFSTSRELGHSNIGTTADMYGHPMEEQQRAIAEGFGQAMEIEVIDTEANDVLEDLPPDVPPDGDPKSPD